MKQIYSAGIVVYHLIDSQPYYLLLQHTDGGHWSFAKGKIEQKEEKEDAALRELYEEAGIYANIDSAFQENISYIFTDHDGTHVHKTVYFFVGQQKVPANEVILSHEHSAYCWVTFAEAVQLLTYDGDKKILKKAHVFLS